MDNIEVFYGNVFQAATNIKIQKDAMSSNDIQMRKVVDKIPLIMDYIAQMPILDGRYIVDDNGGRIINGIDYHIEYDYGKKNFCSYWCSKLLQNSYWNDVGAIWDGAIVSESDIDNLPILIVDGKGVITLDSFVEAIYEVFLLKN
ncbi:MAG: hypothetical protein ACI4GD_05155 [Lachnospiraceae bacterium]